MKRTGFYIIKDSFFEDMDDPYLKGNKEGNRPHYYCLEDKDGLFIIIDDINVYHFDVCRLEDSDEFLAIGGDEYFEKGISIIEWGEIIEDVLPKDYIKIEFSRNLEVENDRKLQIYNLEL